MESEHSKKENEDNQEHQAEIKNPDPTQEDKIELKS